MGRLGYNQHVLIFIMQLLPAVIADSSNYCVLWAEMAPPPGKHNSSVEWISLVARKKIAPFVWCIIKSLNKLSIAKPIFFNKYGVKKVLLFIITTLPIPYYSYIFPLRKTKKQHLHFVYMPWS